MIISTFSKDNKMIDGIKLNIKNPEFAKKLQNNNLFEFTSNLNNSTGELSKNINTDYKNLNINIYDSGTVIIKGSLHKFFNDGKHNYNEFKLNNLFNIINEWVNIFGAEILNAKIDYLEFGVNISSELNTSEILRNLVLHKRKEFKTGTFNNSNYKECSHQQFYLKIYDKAKQYKQVENIIRIECKFVKMADLNQIGVNIFRDLLKPEIYPILGQILTTKWDEVLIIDETIRVKELNGKQTINYNNYINPNYWLKLVSSEKPYSFNKELIKYKSIVKNYSDNIQLKISDLINEKWQKLTDNLESIKNEMAKINYLYIGLDFAKSKKHCLITGLPIDMQKEKSKFLCTTGVKYYFENHKKIYFELLYPRLSVNWHNSELKIQFKEIHHSIRNEYYNKINNTKRSIGKLVYWPSLFDNMLLINPEKLRIINLRP